MRNRGGTISLPASAFLINGQPLTATTTNDNVGETVIALPAGGTQDITFTANPTNQNHYSFNVTAQDVALTILANGIDLSTICFFTLTLWPCLGFVAYTRVI